jgi:predicted HicB family RNase H-like nuclease
MSKNAIKTRRTGNAAGTDRGEGRKQITLVLTERQFKRVNAAAKKEKVSFAEIVRQCIDQAA